MPTKNDGRQPEHRKWMPPDPLKTPAHHRCFVAKQVTVTGWFPVDDGGKYRWFGFVTELDRKVPESELKRIPTTPGVQR